MKKEEFIAKLSERLAVLTEEERQDILDEYEQHIDIKVMRGMSEEAAIADFGQVEALAADILEAYHVRADYAVTEQERTGRMHFFRRKPAAGSPYTAAEEAGSGAPEPAEAAGASGGAGLLRRSCDCIGHGLKRFGEGVRTFCMKAGSKIYSGVCRAGAWLKRAPAGASEAGRRRFGKHNERMEENAAETDAEIRRIKRRKEMKAGTGSAQGAAAGFFRLCAEAVLWCFRWMWNLAWIGAGIVIGFGSCMLLFSLGTLTVLLALGYPLAGVTIGCLGGTMCMVSVTAWCFSMLILKRKRREAREKRVEAAEKEEMVHA